MGNTTAATGKGFAIGSAVLTALALLSAFEKEVATGGGQLSADIVLDRMVTLLVNVPERAEPAGILSTLSAAAALVVELSSHSIVIVRCRLPTLL